MSIAQTSLHDECGFRINGPVIGGDYAAHRQANQLAPAGSDGLLCGRVSDQAARPAAMPEKSGGHQ